MVPATFLSSLLEIDFEIGSNVVSSSAKIKLSVFLTAKSWILCKNAAFGEERNVRMGHER
jgi:hypothetical protein